MIHWIDSAGGNGWQRDEDVVTEAMHSYTIGWVISESDEALCVTGNRVTQEHQQQSHGPIVIPKVAIVEFFEVDGLSA